MTGRQRASQTEPLGPAPWIGAVLLSAATTALALALRALVAVPDLEMLYLLPVLVAAVRFGRGPAVLTAALSVAAYDFFFVQPFHTFAVADVRYLLTFAMMFGVGLVAGTLTTRPRRRQEREAAQRELERVRLAAEAEAASLKARTEELRSSLLSSVSQEAEPNLRFGDLELDLDARVVCRAGAELRLTPIEYRLLAYLARNAGRVLTHRQILSEVWGPGSAHQTHQVRVHLAELRKKVESDPARPRLLITEPGVGHRLKEG